MYDNEATKALIETVEVTETTLKSVFASLITISCGIAGALKYYILFNNTFQMIIHSPILRIIVPGNVAFFFKTLCPIATYDLISSDKTTEKIFKFDYD